jgi:hypothetical protein
LRARQTAQDETNEDVKRVLRGIIQKQGSGDSIQLISAKVLRAQLQVKPLCLDHFFERMNRTIAVWTDKTFAIEDESIAPLTPVSPSDAIRTLRTSRTTLNAQGKDPLNESYTIATALVGGSRRRGRSTSSRLSSPSNQKKLKGSFLAEKKSAHSLNFDDEIEDSDNGVATNGSHESRGLSELPRPRRMSPSNNVGKEKRNTPSKKSQAKKYAGNRIWSDEEKQAIKEGIRKGLTGNWAKIKSTYEVILADRTSGQIKVRMH